MKKIIYSIALLCLAFGVVHAQEEQAAPAEEAGGGDGIAGGTKAVSVNFGVGTYIGTAAQWPGSASYSLSAPQTNWFSRQPMLDVEARYFLTDTWAVKATGGFAYNYNPGYTEVPGSEGTFEEGDVPTYNSIPSSSNMQFAVGIGGDRYWAVTRKSSQLYFHTGVEFGFAYGLHQQKDDSEVYNGASIAEAYAFRGATVVGFDYHFAQALFVGIEVRPLAYGYSVYGIKPQSGFALLAADSHSFSFLERPMIKFGIKF